MLFTKKKIPWCPCPVKNKAYRPGPNFKELLSTQICLVWHFFLDKTRITNQIFICCILLDTGIQMMFAYPENYVEIWLVFLFLSRKEFHAKQNVVLSSSMKLGPVLCMPYTRRGFQQSDLPTCTRPLISVLGVMSTSGNATLSTLEDRLFADDCWRVLEVDDVVCTLGGFGRPRLAGDCCSTSVFCNKPWIWYSKEITKGVWRFYCISQAKLVTHIQNDT